jgi:DNA-directed RNA polymerase subunit RPC12/RpoP
LPEEPSYTSGRMLFVPQGKASRAFGPFSEDPRRYGTMPRTTQCQKCGIILNLPAKASAGKRLRCPHCGVRFVMTVADASSESTLAGPTDADWPSRFELPTSSRIPEELPLPTADRDLRETFDLPLISGRDAERSGAEAEPAIGEAAALLEERATAKRRLTSAEARARARRCSQCGGLVPQGMSICVSCGTDQETGLRVGLADDLAPPPPPPPQGPPVHITLIGGLCGTVGLILLLLSLIRSLGSSEDLQKYGWLCLAMVSAFGIFAAVQFIRGRSAKLLMMALTLGVVIDLMALIALPLIKPNIGPPEQHTTTVNPDDPDIDSTQFKPLEEQFDLRSITLGISTLVIYAILSCYLMSPPVKKYIHPRALERSPW